MLNVQQKYNLKQIVSLWVAVCKPQTLCWAPRGINCTKWGSRNIWKCPEKYWHLTKLPFAFHKLVLIVINHQLSTNKSLFSLNSSKFLMSDLKGGGAIYLPKLFYLFNELQILPQSKYWKLQCKPNRRKYTETQAKYQHILYQIVLNYLIQTR